MNVVAILKNVNVELEEALNLMKGKDDIRQPGDDTIHQPEIVLIAVKQLGLKEAHKYLQSIIGKRYNVSKIDAIAPERILELIDEPELSLGLTEDETCFLYGPPDEKNEIVLKTKKKTIHTYRGKSTKTKKKIAVLSLTFEGNKLSSWEDNRSKGGRGLCSTQIYDYDDDDLYHVNKWHFIPVIVLINYILRKSSIDSLQNSIPDFLKNIKNLFPGWPADVIERYKGTSADAVLQSKFFIMMQYVEASKYIFENEILPIPDVDFFTEVAKIDTPLCQLRP